MAEIGARHHPFKVGYESCTGVRVPPGPLRVFVDFLSGILFTLGEEKKSTYAGVAHLVER